ncbi:MAG: DUF4430 domain-containing protein [Lachnospiraceae bacterium]
MKTGATAMDAIDALLAANGMTGKKKYGGTYLASVTTRDGITLGEFTNGKNSGWLYRVNGTDPGVGACDYELQDGDVVVLHYTDNWEKENGDNPTPEHTHTWSGVITTPATCTTNGVKTYTCSGCKETKTEVITAMGHSFGAWTISSPATVFAPGNKERSCSHYAVRRRPAQGRRPDTDNSG